MKYQAPQLEAVGVASALIQTKYLPFNDGLGSAFTMPSISPSLEAGS